MRAAIHLMDRVDIGVPRYGMRLSSGKTGAGTTTPHLTASKPTTVHAMAMRAATSDSPAISPEATGT